MQKFVICALALIAVAASFPQENEPVYVLRHEAGVNPDGYHFSFETSDGTSRQEQGELKQITDDLRAIAVSGSYQYTAPDGLVHSVTYTADENGYKPIVSDSQSQQSGHQQEYQQYQNQPQQ